MIQNIYASRSPAVSGTFYSSDKVKLADDVQLALKNAKEFKKENIRAIIVPHAGYVFSASVASTAYKTLHKKYKNIFLIGSSHKISFNGASIYNNGNYKTPLGEVVVNKTIVSNLIKSSKHIIFDKNAHNQEHSLEVQLPFLQYIYKNNLKIVPIIVATSNPQTLKEISNALSPYFTDENLFVISTDLSHYPSYEDAKTIDTKTLNAIVSNNQGRLLETLKQNTDKNIDNLLTSACGKSSLLILMNLTQNAMLKYEILAYKNSGDSSYGNKDKVVGYGALRVYEQSFFLEDSEKKELLDIAKRSLAQAVTKNKKIIINAKNISPKLKTKVGAFVTLYKNKKLRGCVGQFEPNKALYEVVIDMAISASRYDNRFNKVTKDELKNIELEISVLTPRKKINSIDEIVIGKHGIYISKGLKHGTYLPHVAKQMNWSVKEFLNSCAKEKAKIDNFSFQNTDVFIYEAIIFHTSKYQ